MKLAQLNVGYALHPLDDPKMSGFMDNLDRINALAERAPGFVWRLQSDSGNATDIPVPGDPRMISNLSVWDGPEALGNYVFNTVHGQFFRRKQQWFESLDTAHFVMWWIDDTHRPDLTEAMDRLHDLRANGPSDSAFGWESVDTSGWRRNDEAAS